MEVRERRSPRDSAIPVPTVDGEMRQKLHIYEGDAEAEEYNPLTSKLPRSGKSSINPEMPYPVRSAFARDEDTDFDDSDSDSDDEDDEMAMMTSCCCCCSTKNGSITVGTICLIFGFFASVGSCFALINVDQFQGLISASFQAYSDAVANNETVATLSFFTNIMPVDTLIHNLHIVFIALLVFYAIYTFSSLFMTYGACADLRTLFLPWLVLEFVPFAVQLAGIVVVFVYGKDDPILSEGGIYIIVGLLQIVAFVIHIYWWMCPLAQYQILKKETEVESLTPPSHPLYPKVQNFQGKY